MIQSVELDFEVRLLAEAVRRLELRATVTTLSSTSSLQTNVTSDTYGYSVARCGKTSLINSLKFAAHGKLRRAKWLQVAGQEKSGGHTMFRKLADITKKISVIDNRGLDDPNTEKAIAELAAQLDGKRGFTDIVEWQGANDENDSDDLEDEDLDLSKPDLNKGYPIGCAVFVFR
ncbi:uncharacterized protein LOC105437815 [Strongylocentrotus purpuratus]|uniref:Uncharacterized protein n=1 Tax=Strongylocentrotus purpuratus TaxID=7668 RepID=A0A7M7SUV1_STRPU|nr:uncharacterized protein LOC105437815 [Strongylocentrotus purpuratus]